MIEAIDEIRRDRHLRTNAHGLERRCIMKSELEESELFDAARMRCKT
jgi:hypothetical protein